MHLFAAELEQPESSASPCAGLSHVTFSFKQWVFGNAYLASHGLLLPADQPVREPY